MSARLVVLYLLFAGSNCAAQSVASGVLGQYQDEDLLRPLFSQTGPNGGPSSRGFRFWPRKVGTADFQGKATNSICIDSVRRQLFVPDALNHRLLVFNLNPDGTFQSKSAAYVLGKPDFFSTISDNLLRDDSRPWPVTSTNLVLPMSAAVDNVRRWLFVADAGNNRVVVYDLSQLATGMPASYVLGQADFTSNQRNRGGLPGGNTLNEPRDLLFDSGRSILWVSDTENNRILGYNLSPGLTNGMSASYVLGQADFSSVQTNRGGVVAANTLSRPRGAALTLEGKWLSVADTGNNRVLFFDVSAGFSNGPAAVRILGQADFTSSAPNRGTSQASAATLDAPQDVEFDDPNNRVLVSDGQNNRVLIYLFSDSFINGESAVAALGKTTLLHSVPEQLPEATDVMMGFTSGLARFGARFFVVDMWNNRILAFAGNALATGAHAIDVLGQYTEGDLTRPSFVQQASNDGPTSFEFDHSDGVSGVAVDTARHLLAVCDAVNGRVLIFQLTVGSAVPGRTAKYVIGAPNFYSIGGKAATAASILRPQRLAFGGGFLFIADDQANRILVFDLSQLTNGMSASYVLGQPDFTSILPYGYATGRVASASTMNRPRGVSYDEQSKRLFVADTNNSRILIFDLNSGIQTGMNANWVLGQPDFSAALANAGASGTNAVGLRFPRDPILDASTGYLYAADTSNNRVVVYDLSHGISNGQAAAYVIGQTDFTTGAAVAARNRIIGGARGIALDTLRRRLYVSNAPGNRTLVFGLSVPIHTGMDAVGLFGQKDFTSNDDVSDNAFLCGANIAIDSFSGILYAVDPTNTEHVVLYFSPDFTLSDLHGLVLRRGVPFKIYLGSGGMGPFDFRITGSLPPGVTMSLTSGILSGTLTTAEFAFSLQVTDGSGRTYASDYSIQGAGGPIITGITPASGSRGSTISATISGSNLIGALRVDFAGAGVTGVVVGASTTTAATVTITVAADATANARSFTITTVAGTSAPFTGFTALSTPTLNSLTATPPGLSQAVAPLFGGPFSLTVNGSNFADGAVVKVGNATLPTILVNATQLTAVVGSSVLSNAGTAAVVVIDSAGTSNSLDMKIVERGDLNGNRNVNIGDALVCALAVGGLTKPALPASVADLNLNGSVNIGDCLVDALFSGGVTANFAIPTITSVSPSPATRGEPMTITGAGFAPVAADNLILFTTNAQGVIRVNPTTVVSTTSMIVTVPNKAVPGPVRVYRIDVPLGGEEFVLPIAGSPVPIRLTSVKPSFQVAIGATITLTGSDFDLIPENDTVLFKSTSGTVGGTVTVASSTSLTVTVPAAAVCGPVTVAANGQTSNARMVVVNGTTCGVQLSGIWGGGSPADVMVLDGAGFDVTRPANNLVQFKTAEGGIVNATVLAAGRTQLHIRIPATAVAGNVTVSVSGITSNPVVYLGPAP